MDAAFRADQEAWSASSAAWGSCRIFRHRWWTIAPWRGAVQQQLESGLIATAGESFQQLAVAPLVAGRRSGHAANVDQQAGQVGCGHGGTSAEGVCLLA